MSTEGKALGIFANGYYLRNVIGRNVRQVSYTNGPDGYREQFSPEHLVTVQHLLKSADRLIA